MDKTIKVGDFVGEQLFAIDKQLRRVMLYKKGVVDGLNGAIGSLKSSYSELVNEAAEEAGADPELYAFDPAAMVFRLTGQAAESSSSAARARAAKAVKESEDLLAVKFPAKEVAPVVEPLRSRKIEPATSIVKTLDKVADNEIDGLLERMKKGK